VRRRRVGLGALLLCIVFPAAADPPPQPRIAIIIDDLGYQRSLGERAISLPGPLAFAVLPGTPNGVYLADRAYSNGKEVLLHLPLQAASPPRNPEPGNLLLDMSYGQFRQALAANLDAVPHISGINTHRGSLLTRHPGHMRWLMDEILERGNLYFIDSYTTADSIALQVARERGIPSVRRDVFLDPDRSPGTIAREFSRLKKVAREQGFAIGIGHPYPDTLRFLEQAIPTLPQDGFALTTIGELVSGSGEGILPAVVTSGQ
jgi:hypothetical protein